MTSRVRLLPTLIGAAAVLGVLRVGAMAAAPEAEDKHAAAEKSEGAEGHEKTPDGDAHADKNDEKGGDGQAKPEGELDAGHDGETQVAENTHAAENIEGQAQTKGEADVLQKLTERREALEARERELVMREQLLLAAQKQVDQRLADLRSLEQKLDAIMAKRNEQEEAQISSLVKSYEAMKPLEAGRIFNKLDRPILLDVASRMKPAKIGAVLAQMDPARAQELTVLLAKKYKVSQIAPAPLAPAAPVPAAAPAAEVEDPVNAADQGENVPVDGEHGPAETPKQSQPGHETPKADEAQAAPHG